MGNPTVGANHALIGFSGSQKASGFFDLRRVPSHTSGCGVSLALREARAERNIDAIRSLKMSPPDHLVFSTWHIHPTKNLPETSPEAFTHLIDYYFAGR